MSQVSLTRAQREVLCFALMGYSNARIAETRGCSVNTVACHMAAVRRAYGVQTFREVVARVLHLGGVGVLDLIQA